MHEASKRCCYTRSPLPFRCVVRHAPVLALPAAPLVTEPEPEHRELCGVSASPTPTLFPKRGRPGQAGEGARVQARTITTLSWEDKGQALGPGGQLPG